LQGKLAFSKLLVDSLEFGESRRIFLARTVLTVVDRISQSDSRHQAKEK
jgi:hypothetical protein